MFPIVSVENMRLSDSYTIDNFVPSLQLMYRAAMGVFKSVSWYGHTAIVVGSGNNGGDGFALACILKEHGFDCTIFTLSRNLSPDSAYFAARCKEADISIHPFEAGCLFGYSIIVDCLLGTGFSGTVRGNYRDAIEAINQSNAFIISVDINSGMNGDTGEAEYAVRSDLTVTIGYLKFGLVTENAGLYIKRLVCADIGIVLVREEGYLSDENCPPWVDRNIMMLHSDSMTHWEEKLLGELVGLARATEGNEHLITNSTTLIIAEILGQKICSEAQFALHSAKIDAAKRAMVPDCFLCESPCGRTAAMDPNTLKTDSPKILQTKFAILNKLRILANSERSPTMDLKLYRGLIILGLEGYSSEELSALFSGL